MYIHGCLAISLNIILHEVFHRVKYTKVFQQCLIVQEHCYLLCDTTSCLCVMKYKSIRVCVYTISSNVHYYFTVLARGALYTMLEHTYIYMYVYNYYMYV